MRVQPVWQARRRIVYLPYAVSLPIAVLLTGLAAVAVARAAAQGELSLGEMALALQALLMTMSLSELFSDSDRPTEYGLHSFGAVERFEQLAADERHDSRRSRGRPRACRGVEIRFENVAFGYPVVDTSSSAIST